jgi:hypothetical protein
MIRLISWLIRTLGMKASRNVLSDGFAEEIIF